MLKETIQRARFLLRALTFRKLDVLDQLEMDHLRVEMLLLRWRVVGNRRRRQELFTAINKELSFHSHLEESLFYPACEKIAELKPIVTQAAAEHKQIKTLLKEIAEIPQGGERAVAKMRLLGELVEHHVAEEENDLFPKVREFMKKNQIDRLSRDLRFAKEQISEKLAA